MSIVTRQGKYIGELQAEIMRLKLKIIELEKPVDRAAMREAAQSMVDDLYETADKRATP